MKTQRQGSCHCGAVRFTATVDLAAGTYRCNCSICQRTRFWPVVVPPAEFSLLQGEAALSEYRFNTQRTVHRFCRHCGVRPFGVIENAAGSVELVAINVGCLEGVTDEELAAAPLIFIDGRHDNWQASPALTRHL